MIQKRKIFFDSSFSKANFELINLDNQIFLKKKIKRPTIRDFESIKKNNLFNKYIKIKNLRSINIDIDSFKDLKRKKCYVMKFINGTSGESILKNLGYSEITLIKNFLKDYFSVMKIHIRWVKFDKSIFIKKFNEIEKKTKNKTLKNIFKKNKKKLLNKLIKIKFYPTGLCHGDLTLSNMIINKNQIYLIDFLKTHNDSIIQDLSKVYQEFKLGWSSRNLNDHDYLRSKIIYNKIVDKNFFKIFPKKILNLLKFEIILTLLRIFPYVNNKDQKTVNWLKFSVEELINKDIKLN